MKKEQRMRLTCDATDFQKIVSVHVPPGTLFFRLRRAAQCCSSSPLNDTLPRLSPWRCRSTVRLSASPGIYACSQ